MNHSSFPTTVGTSNLSQAVVHSRLVKILDRLAEIYDRVIQSGVESLTPVERELYRIVDFIYEYESNGLGGYFYNRLPDVAEIQTAVDAMRRHGLSGLADLLSSALDLFRGYVAPGSPTAWGDVLQQYDPSNHLHDIDNQIFTLMNEHYGLLQSDIA